MALSTQTAYEARQRPVLPPIVMLLPAPSRAEFWAVKYALSERQTAMLREIAAASEAVILPPKAIHTAAALEKRGLIKRTWRSSGPPVAVVTADGRYYLKHGRHPSEVKAAKERLEDDADEAARAPADGAELISRLLSASGKITVTDPAPQTRGRWRAAYYDALHHGHVPEGHNLRWSGRQRGDCVFALVDEEAEKAAQPPSAPAVDVPESLGRPHRLVRATRKALGRSRTVVDTRGKAEVIPLYLSRPLIDRALRVMHALLNEAENRGHAVETRTDLDHGKAVHTLAIVIHGRAFPLVLTERTTKVPHEPTPQEIRQQQRSPWTRPPMYDEKFDGRLAIGAPTGSRYEHAYSYSDGARWTLESRLGRLLQKLEHLEAEAERQQREKKLREAEQRHHWYAAVAQAREQQVERHRAEALTEQMRAWQRAVQIRSFCHAARARAGAISIPADESAWLEWAEGYASQIDPLASALRTPPGPPASREALRELLKSDVYAYPWPFDDQGRWVLPTEDPADQHM